MQLETVMKALFADMVKEEVVKCLTDSGSFVDDVNKDIVELKNTMKFFRDTVVEFKEVQRNMSERIAKLEHVTGDEGNPDLSRLSQAVDELASRIGRLEDDDESTFTRKLDRLTEKLDAVEFEVNKVNFDRIVTEDELEEKVKALFEDREITFRIEVE